MARETKDLKSSQKFILTYSRRTTGSIYEDLSSREQDPAQEEARNLWQALCAENKRGDISNPELAVYEKDPAPLTNLSSWKIPNVYLYKDEEYVLVYEYEKRACGMTVVFLEKRFTPPRFTVNDLSALKEISGRPKETVIAIWLGKRQIGTPTIEQLETLYQRGRHPSKHTVT